MGLHTCIGHYQLIKEKADDYDMELKQKADSLMQKKLK